MGVVLKIGGYYSIDMSRHGFFSGEFGTADITQFSKTKVVGYSYGIKITLKGTGFKSDKTGYIADGIIKSVTEAEDGIVSFSLSGISLPIKKLISVLKTNPTWDDRDLVKSLLKGNDKIQGGSEDDVIHGYKGNDYLFGRGGDDKLKGDAGRDKLTGGAGADKLSGGAGADTFVFKSVKDSTPSSSGRDTIYDFSRSQKDKIDLSAIDANLKTNGNQAFKFIDKQAFHKKAGELRYEKKGGDTFVYGDVNGDGKADFSIRFDDSISFHKNDFIL